MNCPRCQGRLRPWGWNDGSHRGVECAGCDLRWFSQSFEEASYAAKKTAMAKLMVESEFPADAESETAWGERMKIPRKEPDPSA